MKEGKFVQIMVHNNLHEAKYKKLTENKKEQKSHSKKIQRIVSSLVVLLCVGFLLMGGASLVSANTYAYVLNVDGEEIATLVSESEANQSLSQCLSNMSSSAYFANTDLDLSYSNNISIKKVSASGVVYSSVNDTADMLADKLDIVASATVVKINGSDAFYVANDNTAIEAVNAAKNYYGNPQEDPTVIRVYTSEEISLDKAKVPLDDVLNLNQATSMLLYGSTKISVDPKPLITVNVEKTNVQTEILAYKVIKQENSSLARGEENVLTKGVDGIQEVTYKVREVNGVLTGSESLSSEVIVAAVDEVVEVGTQYYISARSDGGGNGYLGWPCDGVISSRFGWRSRGWHSGIDVASPIGTTIFAAESGTVIDTNNESGYGLVVRIDHGNGIVTVYAHCREFYVEEGDTVDRNTAIAAIGMTGTTTGPHVHFEVRIDGQAVNPLDYLE